MDEMDQRLGELTVKQFTEILIAVMEQVIDDKKGQKSDRPDVESVEDTEDIRQRKIAAILKI